MRRARRRDRRRAEQLAKAVVPDDQLRRCRRCSRTARRPRSTAPPAPSAAGRCRARDAAARRARLRAAVLRRRRSCSARRARTRSRDGCRARARPRRRCARRARGTSCATRFATSSSSAQVQRWSSNSSAGWSGVRCGIVLDEGAERRRLQGQIGARERVQACARRGRGSSTARRGATAAPRRGGAVMLSGRLIRRQYAGTARRGRVRRRTGRPRDFAIDRRPLRAHLRRWRGARAATARPERAGHAHAASVRSAARRARRVSGTSTVKQLPCPGVLSTLTSAPSTSARRRTMCSPSPTPPPTLPGT